MNVNVTNFMSFDIAWFTTVPGMLITGGVIVLLIALIVFIASNKKGKKSSPEVATVPTDINTEPVQDMASAPVTDMNMQVQNNNAFGYTAPVAMPPINNVDNNLSNSFNNNLNNNINSEVNTGINQEVSNVNSPIPNINSYC